MQPRETEGAMRRQCTADPACQNPGVYKNGHCTTHQRRLERNGNAIIVRKRGVKPVWTPAMRERFLAVLRSSGNVRAATDAIAVSHTLVYERRKHDRDFALDWRSAVAAYRNSHLNQWRQHAA